VPNIIVIKRKEGKNKAEKVKHEEKEPPIVFLEDYIRRIWITIGFITLLVIEDSLNFFFHYQILLTCSIS
jgi:hypothetical protein